MRFALLLFCLSLAARAQVRLLGTISAADEKSLTLRTDKGESVLVMPNPGAKIQKVSPGERDLSKAQAIALSGAQVGDRVLVRGAAVEGGGVLADSVIVMTARDIATRHDAERQLWRDRGVFGVVEGVDGQQIKLRVRAAAETRTYLIAAGSATDFRRYAPDSVKFSDAVPSKITEIQKGDQLRALGEKDDAAGKVNAERIVFGSFRTVTGKIASVDGTAGVIEIEDLEKKTRLIIRTTADSQLKKFGMRPGGFPGGAPPAGPGGFRGPGGLRPGGPPDIANMLERMPPAKASELTPGDTVIVSSTRGAKPGELTAIMLVAGAEPLLNMLAATQTASQRARGDLSIGGGGMSDGGLSGMISMVP
ncbi:MAG: hypothetical protein SFV51_24280 [Bryobacteraceae bacterium]|nr:hypothetical protein [Bryobacteraceae bacterium]